MRSACVKTSHAANECEEIRVGVSCGRVVARPTRRRHRVREKELTCRRSGIVVGIVADSVAFAEGNGRCTAE